MKLELIYYSSNVQVIILTMNCKIVKHIVSDPIIYEVLYPELVIDSACTMEEREPCSEREERRRQGTLPVRARMFLADCDKHKHNVELILLSLY